MDAISANATATQNATTERDTTIRGRNGCFMAKIRVIKGWRSDQAGVAAISSPKASRVCQTNAQRELRSRCAATEPRT